METSESQDSAESQKTQESTDAVAAPEPEVSPEDRVPSKPARDSFARRLSKTSKIIVVATGVVLALAISASYVGIQPFATYKDIVQQHLTPFGDIAIPVPEDEYPRTRRFTGTYTTTIPALELEQSLTFTNETVTVVDAFAGTLIFRYVATMESESEGMLDLENIQSGDITHVPMQYVREGDCLILYPQGRDSDGVTYCK